MISRRTSRLYILALLCCLLSSIVVADDYAYNNNGGGDDDGGGNDDGNNANANDDGNANANGDDAVQRYQNNANDDAMFSAGDDYIKYWTDYAILPKRCIVYNNVDVIVYSVHEQAYKQCSDDPIGTYISPVPTFLEGYLTEYTQIQNDMGYDDYELPDSAQYAYCTQKQINGQQYWLQMGCTDGTSQSISVNIYSDNTCETRSVVDGYDDANIDVSEIQVRSYHFLFLRSCLSHSLCKSEFPNTSFLPPHSFFSFV